jgi:hypothetical protein
VGAYKRLSANPSDTWQWLTTDKWKKLTWNDVHAIYASGTNLLDEYHPDKFVDVEDTKSIDVCVCVFIVLEVNEIRMSVAMHYDGTVGWVDGAAVQNGGAGHL